MTNNKFKKWIRVHWNLHGDYLNSLFFSNIGEFSRTWIPKKKYPALKREIRRRFTTFSIIAKLGNSRHSCAVTEKTCAKKCTARAKLLLLPLTLWTRCTGFCVIWVLFIILPFLATDQASGPLFVTESAQSLPTPGLSGEACEGTRVHLSWVKAIWSIAISP